MKELLENQVIKAEDGQENEHMLRNNKKKKLNSG